MNNLFRTLSMNFWNEMYIYNSELDVYLEYQPAAGVVVVVAVVVVVVAVVVVVVVVTAVVVVVGVAET